MILKSFRILCVTLLFLAGVILSQRVALADTPVTMHLQGALTYWVMGGVYTSPYEIMINGSTPATLLACDDFATDIHFGDTWLAKQYTLLSDIAANGKFSTNSTIVTFADGTTAPHSIQDQYDAAAWLALQLVTPGSSIFKDTTGETAGEYSYAIWQIFDPAAANALGSTQRSGVTSKMQAAFSAPGLTNVQVYIYTPVKPPDGSTFIFPSQEFIGIESVPEGSTVTLLVFEFLALLGTILLVRRRILRDA